MPVADPRDRGPGDPRLVAQGPHQVVDLAGGDPLDPRGADHRVQGLVHPPARVEQGREERSGPKLGDGELDLPGGGGHRLEALAVAPVGAMRGALIAPRADHGGGLGVDQVLQPGLEQTAEDLVVSEIGVGQDFPDQRGHGRLVRGGHRGCTPCESWSKNLGSHDARRPHGPADPSTPRARGNCHHTKRRTRRRLRRIRLTAGFGVIAPGSPARRARACHWSPCPGRRGSPPPGGRAVVRPDVVEHVGGQSPARWAREPTVCPIRLPARLPSPPGRLPPPATGSRLPLTGVGARSGR